MKTQPALDRVIGSSRAHLVRVYLLTPAGTVVEPLTCSLQDGTVTNPRAGDRWQATLALSGDRWAPDSPTHPLSGLTGHRIRVQLGAVVDTVDAWLTVADVVVDETTVEHAAEGDTVTVACTGLARTSIGRGAERDYARHAPTKHAKTMITRLVNDNRPASWPAPVLNSTTPVTVPGDYQANGRNAWDVVDDLAALANLTVYVDAYQRLVMREPLPLTASPVRHHHTDDVVTATLATGRGQEFANRVSCAAPRSKCPAT